MIPKQDADKLRADLELGPIWCQRVFYDTINGGSDKWVFSSNGGSDGELAQNGALFSPRGGAKILGGGAAEKIVVKENVIPVTEKKKNQAVGALMFLSFVAMTARLPQYFGLVHLFVANSSGELGHYSALASFNEDLNIGVWDIKICDLVTISRLLNATLVIPEIQESTQSKVISSKFNSFSYIYNEEQFIEALINDVIIVKSLPLTLKAAWKRNTEGES
ncbi:hypothetical protein POM88_041365 [Heracleum sosnowskyi]|uniref:O-fucosyltransferase family protein n=1 Tax=Heracleum sosnowskyi TaxID=360622 RepID=A0AAD8HG96_9APIA|nr:hypothetical protein POM88_041365 [Heracleum sosnowskyi]